MAAVARHAQFPALLQACNVYDDRNCPGSAAQGRSSAQGGDDDAAASLLEEPLHWRLKDSIGASKTESAPSGSSGDWLIVYAPKSNGRHTMPPIALLGVTRRRSRAGRQFESQEHVFLHFFFRPYPRCCRLTL